MNVYKAGQIGTAGGNLPGSRKAAGPVSEGFYRRTEKWAVDGRRVK